MHTKLVRRFHNTSLLLSVLLLAACSSGPRVITNSDPEADFTSFRTFSFFRPLSTDRAGATSIMSSHLIAATTKELEMSGMRREDNNPDLLINFFVTTREVIRASSTPSASMSMHHGRGRYGTWSGHSMGVSTTQVSQSTEGMLRVDLVDPRRNQLVWEGSATARVTEARRDNLEETIFDAIAHIFAQFP